MKKRRHAALPGFTLVELMVVLAIIGILTTIVAVNVFKTQDVAKIKAAKLGIENIKNALNLYYTSRNRYPRTLEELAKEDFIKGKLSDPWDVKYVYLPRMSEDDDKVISYEVFSCGPDRRRGTSDDIGNPNVKSEDTQ